MRSGGPPRATSLPLLLSAIAIAVASLASFLGWVWWPFDVASSARPHFAVVLLTMGALLVLARRPRSGLLILLVAILNAVTVVPLFIGPRDAGTPIGGSLSVMTFNVNGLNDRYDDVIAQIAAEDPDVVFIHEATFLWEDALSESGLPYRTEPGRTEPLDFGTLALVPNDAMFQSFGFATTDPRAVEVRLTASGVPVRVLGTHPLSPDTEVRAELRDMQLDFATQWAAARSGVRTVVAGDFNATPWSYTVRRLLGDGDLFNSQRGYGLELTFPAGSNPIAQVPIDHVLYSEGLAVTDRRLGPASGSDHFPVVVDFVLTDP